MTTSLSPTVASHLPDLGSVLDEDLLTEMIQGGYVRVQSHPSLPYVIHNYAEKTAYEGVWNGVTLTCRGLIVDGSSGRVIARPFPKFFNHGQAGAPVLDLYAEAIVTDKADGSLGILYPTPGGYAIATRGSFASEQAIHATEVWRTRYAHRFDPSPGVTYLFEIVYPENRIVLDYEGLDDLVLLGAIDIITGGDVSYMTGDWPGPRTTQFPYACLAEALAAPPRPNAEGLVVYFPGPGHRLKIKYEEYVRLHKIVTGLTARTVWQHMVDGKPLADLIEPLPDEFHGWVNSVALLLTGDVTTKAAYLRIEFDKLRRALPHGARRIEFALATAGHPDRWAMFNLLDGVDIRPELLKRAKPEAFMTPSGRTYGEDTA